ncbi:hypothetical protein D3C78_998300 [compost metagenome]
MPIIACKNRLARYAGSLLLLRSIHIRNSRHVWLRHAITQIEACVRRLIIGYVLPSNAETIDWIMHQGTYPMLRYSCRGIDAQL